MFLLQKYYVFDSKLGFFCGFYASLLAKLLNINVLTKCGIFAVFATCRSFFCNESNLRDYFVMIIHTPNHGAFLWKILLLLDRMAQSDQQSDDIYLQGIHREDACWQFLSSSTHCGACAYPIYSLYQVSPFFHWWFWGEI